MDAAKDIAMVLSEDSSVHGDNASNAERKERKGGSYVWKYCAKLSRHSIRCNLCNKIMSFHGTANVITHLQRKHNIMGKIEANCQDFLPSAPEIGSDVELQAPKTFLRQRRRRRPTASASIVWKYCKRISTDAVRCCFCKKNLSFQGTSNLQRHLHRMHNIVTQGRPAKDVEAGQDQGKCLNSESIWEYCSALEGDRVRCNLCTTLFEAKDMNEILKHLTVNHAIEPRWSVDAKREHRKTNSAADLSENEEYENSDHQEWIKQDAAATAEEFDIKKTDSMFVGNDDQNEDGDDDPDNDHDIIEEDNEELNYSFGGGMLQDITLTNPLSPHSSHEGSQRSQYRPTSKRKRIQKLSEERLKMETEYFREKAGYYRMQKYLTALQAKKVRTEIDRLGHTGLLQLPTQQNHAH